jgi:protein SCO1/2
MRYAWLLFLGFLFSCSESKPAREVSFVKEHLPVMGPVTYGYNEGSDKVDTVYHRIPDFSFTNQFGLTFSEKDIEGKVYLADFFFTSCPTICPKMTETMARVAKETVGLAGFLLVSHTIDPQFDTPEVLRAYASEKGGAHPHWIFLTGEVDALYDISEHGYMAFAKEAPEEPGGFTHSGFLVLVDQKRQIRAVYDGTRPEIAPEIIKDIHTLLNAKTN